MRYYLDRSNAKAEDEEGAEGPITDARRLHNQLKEKGAPKVVLRRSRSKISSARRAVNETREAKRALRDMAGTPEPGTRTKKAVLEKMGFYKGWSKMTPEQQRIERAIQRNSYKKTKRARRDRKGKSGVK